MNQLDQPEEFEKLKQVKRDALLEFCYSSNKTKTFNTRRTSYGLKHVFERKYRESLSGTFEGSYVTNGQFKGAMLEAGFDVKGLRGLA